jgi:hypothetical protein
MEYFTFNSCVHNIDTIKRLQLQRPIANSTSFQMGVCEYKDFNKITVLIANLVMGKKNFVLVLKKVYNY